VNIVQYPTTRRTVETFEEYDADGKLVKRTVLTVEAPMQFPQYNLGNGWYSQTLGVGS
jgi:hypothetical protein